MRERQWAIPIPAANGEELHELGNSGAHNDGRSRRMGCSRAGGQSSHRREEGQEGKVASFPSAPRRSLDAGGKEENCKEVWDYLKTRFVGVDCVKNARLQMLKGDFNAMHMQDGETLDQYTKKLNAMSFRYANLGEMLDDAALVKKLFDTVSDQLLSVIARIEQLYDLNKMQPWGG